MSLASGETHAINLKLSRARLAKLRGPHSNQAADILNSRYQQELFGDASETSQLQASEAELPFHMGEQH